MQETMSYIISSGTRLLCAMNEKQITIRPPNESEMKRGVPQWFRVQEVTRAFGIRVDKYYFSMEGHRFRSIKELKLWRENLQFEDMTRTRSAFRVFAGLFQWPRRCSPLAILIWKIKARKGFGTNRM